MESGNDQAAVEADDQRRAEEPRSSRVACDTEDHSGCPHVPILAAYRILHPHMTVGPNGLATPALTLCRCRCHEGCPVSIRPEPHGWPEGCNCNATLRMRDSERRRVDRGASADPRLLDPVVLKKIAVKSIRTDQARRAATARGAGQRSERIEEIVVEEWRRRGLVPPSGVGMERTIDLIAHPPDLTERARNQARLGSDLFGLPLRVRRATKGGLGRLLERAGRDHGRVFEVAGGDDFVGVSLEPGSDTELERLARQAIFLPSLMCTTTAELKVGAAGDVEVWAFPPPEGPSEATRALGTIPDSAATDFERLLAIAARVHQPCVCLAAVLRRRYGGLEMIIARPLVPDAPAQIGRADESSSS
jgi:hypothetical protein